MAEIGRIRDRRCRKALDLLEGKQLPHGGWAAEKRFYTVASGLNRARSTWTWTGAASTAARYEWVTADALHVLLAAGRM